VDVFGIDSVVRVIARAEHPQVRAFTRLSSQRSKSVQGVEGAAWRFSLTPLSDDYSTNRSAETRTLCFVEKRLCIER
jgi:hypothetical protein